MCIVAVMAKNMTNVHKKLDRILQRLSTLDERQLSERRRSDAQIRLLAQLVGAVQQEVRVIHQEAQDMSAVMMEALKASRESAERTAAILSEIRKH